MKVPAYMPLVLRWKPVGENSPRALAHAYLVIDIQDGDTAALFRGKVGEASYLPREGPSNGLRFLARTDARGVVMAVPPAGGPREVRDLSALAPVMWPVGAAVKLWWTHSEEILDAVLAHPDQGLPVEGRLELCFGEDVELPEALDQVLVELDDGPALRSLLIKPRDEVYPRKILRIAEDAETWCVDLRDDALEIALDMALTIARVAELPDEVNLPAHQMLLGQVFDILRRRSGSDDWKGVIWKHENVGGPDYRYLADEMDGVLNDARREIQEAGRILERVLEAALLELSLHGYPKGSYERTDTPGIVSRNWASKTLLSARALCLRDELIQTLYDSKEEGLRDRLLKIAKGEADPVKTDGIEVFLAQNKAVIAWLSEKSPFIDAAIKIADLGELNSALEITNWIEQVVIAAARKEPAATGKVTAAIVSAMRMAQVWAGLEPDFEIVGAEPRRLALMEGMQRHIVQVDLYDVERWAVRFERAAALLRVISGLNLIAAAFTGSGGQPSIFDQMVKLHGFADGLERTYRLVTKAAETELGVLLKGFGEFMGPIGIFVSAGDVWKHLQAGNSLATILSMAGVAVEIFVAWLQVVRATPGVPLKISVVLLGVGFAVGASLAYNEDEKFLAEYRPDCGDTGAYANARSAVSTIRHELKHAQGSTHIATKRANKLELD